MSDTKHIEELVIQYANWLKQQTRLAQVGQWVEITTPYLDRHNDYIQIYAKLDNGNITLSDDGYTLKDLELSGCKLESPKRQKLLQQTLNGFAVKLDNNDCLQITANEKNFPLRKHSLIQAMLAVNDLFYLATPSITSLFFEDVVAWLDLCDIRYTPKVKFTGSGGYDHLFDFVIPKSKKSPERILQTVSNPKKDNAQSLAFAWIDTKDVRPANSQAFAILNDSETNISPHVKEVLKSYDITSIPFSKRDEFAEQLAA
jgi:Domain of unknown function DUF1829/Domain of unknown function DUF1828